MTLDLLFTELQNLDMAAMVTGQSMENLLKKKEF
jgi:hypothetical protein